MDVYNTACKIIDDSVLLSDEELEQKYCDFSQEYPMLFMIMQKRKKTFDLEMLKFMFSKVGDMDTDKEWDSSLEIVNKLGAKFNPDLVQTDEEKEKVRANAFKQYTEVQKKGGMRKVMGDEVDKQHKNWLERKEKISREALGK